jgi:hypothetical protein
VIEAGGVEQAVEERVEVGGPGGRGLGGLEQRVQARDERRGAFGFVGPAPRVLLAAAGVLLRLAGAELAGLAAEDGEAGAFGGEEEAFAVGFEGAAEGGGADGAGLGAEQLAGQLVEGAAVVVVAGDGLPEEIQLVGGDGPAMGVDLGGAAGEDGERIVPGGAVVGGGGLVERLAGEGVLAAAGGAQPGLALGLLAHPGQLEALACGLDDVEDPPPAGLVGHGGGGK